MFLHLFASRLANVAERCSRKEKIVSTIQEIDDTEDLEMMLFEALPCMSPEMRRGYDLITEDYELYEIEMTVLAKAFTYVFGPPVTFKEDGGPGGIISDIVVHWDQIPSRATAAASMVED
jgi:hypothetical protein